MPVLHRAQLRMKIKVRKIEKPSKDGYSLHESYKDFWVNTIIGVVLALGIWPYGIYVFSVLDEQVSPIFSESVPTMVVAMLMHLMLGITISVVVVTIAAATAAASVALVSASLRRNLENRKTASLIGGVTALLVTLPILSFSTSTRHGCTMLILAMLGAHSGATWGSRKAMVATQKKMKYRRPSASIKRFGILDMLIVTTWVAVALASLKVAGLLTMRAALVLSVWALTQTVLIRFYFYDSTISQDELDVG